MCRRRSWEPKYTEYPQVCDYFEDVHRKQYDFNAPLPNPLINAPVYQDMYFTGKYSFLYLCLDRDELKEVRSSHFSFLRFLHDRELNMVIQEIHSIPVNIQREVEPW